MRLDRYLSQSLSCSRSEAKILLKSKRVECNGEVIKSSSHQVQEHEQITLDQQPLSLPTFSYWMLYKPAGVVCANEDTEHPTVFDLLPAELSFSPLGTVHCVGRLDLDTTGLVLITDDGQWSHRVTSPNAECSKRYQVQLKVPFENPESVVEQFKQGLQLNNEFKLTAPAELQIQSENEATVEISEGRYHQVKRMFAAVGNRVVGLHRDRIGPIELDLMMDEGEYRHLTDEEIAYFMPVTSDVS